METGYFKKNDILKIHYSSFMKGIETDTLDNCKLCYTGEAFLLEKNGEETYYPDVQLFIHFDYDKLIEIWNKVGTYRRITLQIEKTNRLIENICFEIQLSEIFKDVYDTLPDDEKDIHYLEYFDELHEINKGKRIFTKKQVLKSIKKLNDFDLYYDSFTTRLYDFIDKVIPDTGYCYGRSYPLDDEL